jgi:protein phosphatase
MIPTEKPHLAIGALSHPGETRDNNEDSFSVTSYRLEAAKTPSVLAIVADGIGGHQAGEVASKLAVEILVEKLGRSSARKPLPQMESAIVAASKAISKASEEDDKRMGMGSTVAIAWVIGDRLHIASVGDSRIYFLRDQELRQISIDHTWIQEALDHGIITPDEADDHPHAHVLRRHLGGDKVPQPDLRLRLAADESDSRAVSNQGLRLKAGEQILLCSDGLTDLVEIGEIQKAMLANRPEAATKALVDLARSRGGHDNITVVALRMPEDYVPPKRRRRFLPSLLGSLGAGLLLLLIIAGSMFALYWFDIWPW